jgi:hypothetical protein
MNEKAANRALQLAAQHGYPVNSGHTGFRDQSLECSSDGDCANYAKAMSNPSTCYKPDPKTNPDAANANGTGHCVLRPKAGGGTMPESARTAWQISQLGALGGMMGIGWHGGDVGAYLTNFRFGRQHAARHPGKRAPAYTLGSDINGFVTMPPPRGMIQAAAPGERAAGVPHRPVIASVPPGFTRAQWDSNVQYSGANALQQYQFGPLKRSWDYNTDGVAHIGLYPDAYQDLKNIGMTVDERVEFFNAADSMALMWDRMEAFTHQAPSLRAPPPASR